MSICATVGRPIINKIDVCIHDGFVVFDDLRADQLFTYYALKWIEPDWSQHGQQGSQMNLNASLITGTRIFFPPMSEQAAISAVLSDMDAELSALETRCDKTCGVKQAMMQEQLTGKTRLVSTGAGQPCGRHVLSGFGVEEAPKADLFAQRRDDAACFRESASYCSAR